MRTPSLSFKRPLFAVLATTGVLLMAGACLVWAGSAETPIARLQQDFAEAGQAYNQGRFLDAAGIYQRLLAEGYSSRELLYNLANARYKSGQWAEAILFYRRAWHLAPRDPDIQANLRFALQTVGAVPPERSFFRHLLETFSLSEWLTFALAAYWLGALVFCASLFLPQARTLLRQALGVFVFLLVVSLLGTAHWLSFYHHPEVVVRTAGQKALSGPLVNAVALFALPNGALMETVDSREGWISMQYDQQTGWIPQSEVTPVVNWATLRTGVYPP